MGLVVEWLRLGCFFNECSSGEIFSPNSTIKDNRSMSSEEWLDEGKIAVIASGVKLKFEAGSLESSILLCYRGQELTSKSGRS